MALWWALPFFAALSCAVLVLGCEAKDRASSSPPPAPAFVAPAGQGPSVSDGSDQKRPEELSLDLVTTDPSAPWGGLRSMVVGRNQERVSCLVLLFHGYGAYGDDLSTLAGRLHEHAPCTYVLLEAPFALKAGGRAWFARDRSNFAIGLGHAKAALLHARSAHPRVPVAIGGFSQGAMITANLLAAVDQSVVGALIFSPGFLLVSEPNPSMPRPAVLVSHGTLDTVLPFSEGVKMRDRLKELGYEVTWVEFIGPHTIAPEVVAQSGGLLRRAFAAAQGAAKVP